MRHFCSSKEQREGILKQGLRIAGIRYKAEAYKSTRPPLQCYKCQELGHISYQCSNNVIKCMRCAGPHSTKDCTDKDNNKCANCQGGHSANSVLCPLVKEAKIAQETKQISYAAATAKKGDTTECTRLASCLVEILHTIIRNKPDSIPTSKSICEAVAVSVSRHYKTKISTHHLSTVIQAFERLASHPNGSSSSKHE